MFVIPSLDDNFPTTVIEAFANSTPVIGFNQGGIPEQVTSDVGEIIYDISSSGLKNGIDNILKNDKRREILSVNCRKKFEELYTYDKFLKNYFKIYDKLI